MDLLGDPKTTMPKNAVVSAETSGTQPPINPLADALNRARNYTDSIARSIVAESYPELSSIAAAQAPDEPEKPEAPPPAPPEEPETADEPVEGEEPDAPAENPPAGEPEETEGDEDGEEAIPVTGVSEDVQKAINKRIGKEVAKTKAEREAKSALETELATVRAELEQLRATPAPEPKPVPASDNPMSSIADVTKLDEERGKAQKTMSDASELLERMEDEPEVVVGLLRRANIQIADENEDGGIKAAKRFLRSAKNIANRTLNEHIPERLTYLDRQSAAQARALEMVPELADPSSVQSKLFRNIVGNFPAMKADPNWPIYATVQMVGLSTLQKAKPAANGAAKAKAPPAKIPAKPKSAASTSSAQQVQNAKEADLLKLAQSGDREARIQLLQSRLQSTGVL